VQIILQSGFLQALAYALLNSIWQMGLLWLAVVFIFRIFKLSSSQKFTVAFTAQVFGFSFFIFTLLGNYNNEQPLSVLNLTNISYINNASGFFNYIMPFIAILYLIFFVWHIVKFIFSYRLTQNLRSSSNLIKMPAVNRVFVEELTSVFSLHKKVKIYISKTIRCPLTIGFFKPLILIPLAAVNYLTKEQMEAVILHELAHIKRADYLFYLLQCVMEKVFFFNIFSRMLNNIIERERENACDDWVLQFKYNSYHYAEALLKLGKLQTSSLAMAASGKKENMLLHRIKRLVHNKEKNNAYEHTALRFSFLTLIIALCLLVSFSAKTPEIVTSLHNPAVNNTAEKNYNKTIWIPDKNSAIPPKSNKKIATGNSGGSKNAPAVAPEAKKHVTTVKKSNVVNQDEALENYTQQISPYLINVNQEPDTISQPTYSEALNKQLVLNKDAYKKALSYQNFKQLETMLALTGDSITVTEDSHSTNNYKKLITIETIDKDGNKNIYKVIVELYQ
jgi:beta-lactamase regulating signal transducer with metallopeptidase domain